MLVIFFLFNLITKNHNLLNIYFYFSNPEIYWGWLPSLLFLVWGRIGDIVEVVEIDENRQTIRIYYYKYGFRRKEDTYFISDTNFAYDYDFSKRKTSWLSYIVVSYTSASIYFYERKDMKVKFNNVMGWNKSQMREICNALEKYKNKLKSIMYINFNKNNSKS